LALGPTGCGYREEAPPAIAGRILGLETVEHAYVLVVEVDVDVAVQTAVGGEQLRLRIGMAVGDGAQDLSDV